MPKPELRPISIMGHSSVDALTAALVAIPKWDGSPVDPEKMRAIAERLFAAPPGCPVHGLDCTDDPNLDHGYNCPNPECCDHGAEA